MRGEDFITIKSRKEHGQHAAPGALECRDKEFFWGQKILQDPSFSCCPGATGSSVTAASAIECFCAVLLITPPLCDEYWKQFTYIRLNRVKLPFGGSRMIKYHQSKRGGRSLLIIDESGKVSSSLAYLLMYFLRCGMENSGEG